MGNNSGGKYYAINDKIGSSGMPVEGAERPRSFLDGTGIKKYDKDDPSVAAMRKERAKLYAKKGVGVGLAAQSASSLCQKPDEIITDFKSGRKNSITIGNILSIENVKNLVLKLTGVSLSEEKCRLDVIHQIPNSTTMYSLFIASQENQQYRINVKVIGFVKQKKRKTLLEEMREQKRKNKKETVLRIKNRKKSVVRHENGIRGFDKIDNFTKKEKR